MSPDQPPRFEPLLYPHSASSLDLQEIDLWAITYPSDTLLVQGFVAHPRGPGPYPCLIYNRGGYREGGKLSDDDAVSILARIAAWGYVVVASHYRGHSGMPGEDTFGGDDVQDVLSLLPVLDALSIADTSRIGMWGWSRGGLMTYRALTQTDRIRAAIIVAGVTDCCAYLAQRPDMAAQVFANFLPAAEQERDAALRLRSPLLWPDQLPAHTPLLLIHGTGDWRVAAAHSLQMATALYSQRHPFRLVIFEGGDHALTEYQAELWALAQSWLNQYVRDLQPWPAIEPHGI